MLEVIFGARRYKIINIKKFQSVADSEYLRKFILQTYSLFFLTLGSFGKEHAFK